MLSRARAERWRRIWPLTLGVDLQGRVLGVETWLRRIIVLWFGEGSTLCAWVCRIETASSRNIAPIITSIEGGSAGRARGRGVGEAAVRRGHLTTPSRALRRHRRFIVGAVAVVTPFVVVISWTSGIAPLLCYVSINIRPV